MTWLVLVLLLLEPTPDPLAAPDAGLPVVRSSADGACVNPETGARYDLLRWINDGTDRGRYELLPCDYGPTPTPTPTPPAELPVRAWLSVVQR